jgi:hypothetical protein
METVENHISTLTEEDPKVVHFVKILATCTTRHAEGYMHKIGMIPHERVAEIGRAMGIATVTENEREIFHREAVKLGTLLMDGVIASYVHKRSNGKLDGLKQLAELRQRRTLRKETASKRAAKLKLTRKNKLKVSKQTRMTDYHALNQYGQQDHGAMGAEDSRRQDASVG